jgi:hypothetical protein
MNTLFYVVCIVAIVFTADTIQKYLKVKPEEGIGSRARGDARTN